MVELGVVEDDSVAEAGVKVEEESIRDHVSKHSVWVLEGVAHPTIGLEIHFSVIRFIFLVSTQNYEFLEYLASPTHSRRCP